MAKPKEIKARNVMQPGQSMEGMTRHKDHWHTADGHKFYGTSENFNEDELTPHKDHFHTKDGAKVFLGEGGTKDKPRATEPPSEEDVMDETINKQRELQRRARSKMGSAHTMLGSGSGGPYSRSNKLV